MTGIIGLPLTVGSSVSESAYTFTSSASTLNTRDFHCLARTIPLLLEFWQAGYRTQQLQALNRCRLAHQLIFLSDMALACGQYIDLLLLQPPSLNPTKCCSSYNFPNCYLSQNDWKLWLDFWMSTTGNLGLLHIPLAEWLYRSHRTWQ
jgi:hypothetical protein